MCGFCYPEAAPVIGCGPPSVPAAPPVPDTVVEPGTVCIHGHDQDDAHVCGETR